VLLNKEANRTLSHSTLSAIVKKQTSCEYIITAKWGLDRKNECCNMV